MQRVQSEKVAVFLPLNVRPPKKKSTSCNKKQNKIKIYELMGNQFHFPKYE